MLTFDNEIQPSDKRLQLNLVPAGDDDISAEVEGFFK